MKILKVIAGEHITVYTDATPEESGIFRRLCIEGEYPTFSWEWLMDRNGGTWLRLFDDSILEETYQLWLRKEKSND